MNTNISQLFKGVCMTSCGKNVVIFILNYNPSQALKEQNLLPRSTKNSFIETFHFLENFHKIFAKY